MTTETARPGAPITGRAFAIFSIIAGAVGWFASFKLLTEHIKTLSDPAYVPDCAVSILVTCGPNMDSAAGSLFGFTNGIVGVAAFTAPIFLGFALLAGARFRAWFWLVYQLGLLGGFVFVVWLQYQSMFHLGTLCPWCMVIWAAMIPLWWVGAFWPYSSGHVSLSERSRSTAQSLMAWAWVFIVLNILIVAAVAQLQVDWFAEIARM